MRVKRYIVNSMPEALEKIRVDLGRDAVILNSKPIKTGGLFGIFAKQQLEVIAAVDERADEREKPVRAREAGQEDAKPRLQTGTYTAQQAYRKAHSVKTQERKEETVVSPPEQAVSRPEDEAPRTKAPGSSEIAETGGVATAVPVSRVSTSSRREQAADNGTHDALANEVRDMRQMFQRLLVKDLSNQLPAALQTVRARLTEQEVSEQLTAEVIRQLMERTKQGEDWKEEEALQASRKIISDLLAASEPTSLNLGPSTRFAFFFGPTGVGKTTTIAKLAASSMLKEKRKIGFITADTYRMAAVEQLKTYANILNVPLEVVFSPNEMVQAIERLSHCDLIFVDTAGRNFRNDEYVRGIRELVQHGRQSVNYLVLSLTSKYNDMKAIIHNFSDVPVSTVIFTKADETTSYGTMLNVAKEEGLSLSYITTGQNVPDDIMQATPALVSTMIMGDGEYARSS